MGPASGRLGCRLAVGGARRALRLRGGARRLGLARARGARRLALFALLGLLAVRLRARLLGAGAVVGLVEPGPLEDETGRGEHLGELAAVGVVLGQRRVGERLGHLEVLAALLAAVLVGRHQALRLVELREISTRWSRVITPEEAG